MSKATVAVIGAGPTGISMLKTLREDGFDATLFERRDQVGGLWAYSENKDYTTALKSTHANISKYTCGYTDYPMPDHFPSFMSQPQFQEFMQSYAEHFDLLSHTVFNASVTRVYRDDTDSHWILDIDKPEGKRDTVHFDKVAFCHGYQTRQKLPQYPGLDTYEGSFTHFQQYRDPLEFKGKKVVLVGISNSLSDAASSLIPHVAKLYVSHRRGSIPLSRYRNGIPTDLLITWRRRVLNWWLQGHMPGLHKFVADQAIKFTGKSMAGQPLDPAWRLEPFPSMVLRPAGIFNDTIEALADGSLTSLHGIKRFLGGKSIEFDDGTVLEDVDAVICCTGYTADWSVAPFVETSTPKAHGYGGPPMYRLYMNMFPPKYADSCVMLCYSTFGKNNGFSFSDVSSMAVSNIWRGVSSDMIPPRDEMERWVDQHQDWVASCWAKDNAIDTSMVRQWMFQQWQHKAAGTGMENLGWGLKGWKFWWKDPEMYNMMNHGPETAHAFRFFETGKRKVWPGARAEIIHQNELVKKLTQQKTGDHSGESK